MGHGDDLYVLIEIDTGKHPKLATEFLGVLLEEDNIGPITVVENETPEPNDISSANAADFNSVSTPNPGVYGGIETPTPIFLPIKPTPDTHINEEPDYDNQESNFIDEGSDDNYDSVEEIEIPEEDTPYQITI